MVGSDSRSPIGVVEIDKMAHITSHNFIIKSLIDGNMNMGGWLGVLEYQAVSISFWQTVSLRSTIQCPIICIFCRMTV